ncbi:signal peptidase II [Cryptosporangium sp. NPDC048952]|uniref:signal peptidase II n=1 Tax=Cryptosporangium sp. NPDC048952 TaxID=3363961 RepID=UPI003720DFDA
MRSRYGWFLVWAAVVLVIDQATKYWAEHSLDDGREITVIPPLIDFRLVYNPGAAFSIGESFTWVFAIAAAAAVVGILYYARRLTSLGWTIALGAVLGGATSHLGDRLFREPGFARGHVVDFIDYNGFFVGNVADIALVLGAIAMALLTVREVPIRNEPADSASTEATNSAKPADSAGAANSAGAAGAAESPRAAEIDDGEAAEKRTP